MKTIKLYEVGEEVLVKAKITGVVIKEGEIRYALKNTITGKDYDYLFKDEDIVYKPEPTPKKIVKTTTPITE